MMKRREGLQLSASDLIGFVSCRHLTNLEHLVAQGELKRPAFRDPFLELLIQRGAIHEAQFVEHLASSGVDVVRIDGPGIESSQKDRKLR